MKLECQGVLALEFHLGGTGVYELLALCREVRDKMNVGTYSAMPYVPTLFVSGQLLALGDGGSLV